MVTLIQAVAANTTKRRLPAQDKGSGFPMRRALRYQAGRTGSYVSLGIAQHRKLRFRRERS